MQSLRITGPILCIATLLWGFTQAPFLHIHVEEVDHPAASLVHVHVHSAQKPSSPAIEAHPPDDDAIDLDWRVSTPQTSGLIFALAISDNAVVAPPVILATNVSVPRHRSHDPPDLIPKQPRSPPA